MERRKDLEETLDLLCDVLISFKTDYDHESGETYRKFYNVIKMNEEYLKDGANPWTSPALNKIVKVQKQFIGCTPVSIFVDPKY